MVKKTPAAAERLARSFNAAAKVDADEPRQPFPLATITPAAAGSAAAGGMLVEAEASRTPIHDTWPFQQPAFNSDAVTLGQPVFKVGPAAPKNAPLPVPTPSVMSSLDAVPPAAPNAAPVSITQPVAPAPLEEAHPALDVAVLSLSEGLLVLQAAASRDAVFEALCRIARARFSFTTIFAVQGDAATARMALGPAFFDGSALAGASIDLREPSPIRTAVQTLSPFIGRLSEDEPLGRTLSFLGRPLPAPGALLPIVLRERAVAVIVADNDARPIVTEDLADLIQATAEAGKAFLRIIQASKKPKLTPASVPAVAPAAAPREAVQEEPAALISDIVSSANAVPLSQAELSRLLGMIEREEPEAATAAASFVTAGDAAVRLLATRFPGPLRFGHRKLHTIALSPVEHGPLIALASRLGERVVPSLVRSLDDASPDTRFHAALVLGELRAEIAATPLGQHLFDPDVAVRRAAAHALSRFPPSGTFTSLLERIREALGSGDLARERAAAVALGELRDVTSVPQLIDQLKHRDMESVEVAQRALIVICKQDFGTARWRWRSWWEKAKVETRAEWLLAGLEQQSTEAQRSAAEELAAITSDRFGAHARLSRREREEAARKFAAWHRAHPGIFGEDRRTQN